MPDKQWTFLCLRDGESPVRQVRVSTKAIHYVASAVAGAVVVLTALSTMVLMDGSARIDARNLTEENALLTDEIGAIEGQVGELTSSLNRLTEQDERYRVIAGLNAIDAEVLQVGVGGPGLPRPEDSPLWAYDEEASQRSFAVSYDVHALERRARLLSESLSEATDSLEAHHDLLQSTPSILPTDGLLTSGFSKARMHPIHQKELPHEGIDVTAPAGTPILAAAKGTVTYSGWRSGYGNTIEIDHGFGYMTRYGHSSKLLVRAGQIIERGTPIAEVGRTGVATNNHVHYEVWVNGRAQNPMNFIIPGVIP
jgi:murein DD-endopeptidase MepM/ murein hydrolase activator NlpD